MTHSFIRKIELPIIEQRHDDKGNYRRIQVGVDHVLVRVEVDVDAIARQLGGRAWGSKSKKSQFMHGKIKVFADRAKVVA